ncbi:MAG: EthD family reductase [Thermomicrobiales bacterium]|nr:EthD family reductase [Thermomicrobiales bacterium]
MFTVVWLVKKRADLSQEEFARYWIDEHTPLTAATPGMHSYRCYPMVAHDGAAPSFDAIAFATFDDEAAWRVAEQSPELQAAIADAVNFQEVDLTQSFYAAEHVIR